MKAADLGGGVRGQGDVDAVALQALLELLRESASLEDVFRNLTTGDLITGEAGKGES